MATGIFNVELMADIMHDIHGIEKNEFYKSFINFSIDFNKYLNDQADRFLKTHK